MAKIKILKMRILIADDHAIVREGLCSLLKFYKDLEICGEASNGEEAIQKAIQLKPHLVILDVTMPVLNGFGAAKKINELMPKVPILMLSMHGLITLIRALALWYLPEMLLGKYQQRN